MSTAKSGLYIIGDTVQPSNYTRIPNIAIEQLEVYAFKLLAIFMDVARTTSKVWMSNKSIAKKLGCSVNRMKKARQELEDKGYVLIDIGTETTRANITVLFTDIWKMNADYHEETNPKPQKGVSPYDTPLSWDDTPLSPDDTLTKQDNITRQEKEVKTPPIPPTGGEGENTPKQKKPVVVDTELVAMEQAVKTILKQSTGRQQTAVAKVLLKRHTGKKAENNLDGQAITPEQLKQFGAWWDANKKDRDGKPLTRPKNMGSVKTWVDEWQQSLQPQKPKIVIVPDGERGFITDSASEGVIRYEKDSA